MEGYACLYKSYGETVDAVKADDITMTLVRETKPKGLFRYFEEHGYQVSNPYAGIYYVRGNTLFPAQIVVTKELDSEAHIWLKALSEKLEKHDIRKLLVHIRQLKGKFDIELADAVLEVSMLANERIVEELMGDDSMSEAFLEMVKPIIEPLIVKREKECMERALQKGMEQGMQQGIQGTVSVLRRLEVNEGQIMKSIMEQYSLTEEEAKRYTQQ